MKVRVTKAFKFSPDGIQIVEYSEGVQVLPKRAAQVALKEGWAVTVQTGKKTEGPTKTDPPSDDPDGADERTKELLDQLSADGEKPTEEPPTNPPADPPEESQADNPNATGNIVDRLKAKVTGKK